MITVTSRGAFADPLEIMQFPDRLKVAVPTRHLAGAPERKCALYDDTWVP